MKCTIPEISWHNRDPVLSVDIQPNVSSDENKSGKVRLASGGSDSHVLVRFSHVKLNSINRNKSFFFPRPLK